MRKHQSPQKGLSLLLAAALIVTFIPGVLAFSEERSDSTKGGSNTPTAGPTATYQKSESVYANLAADGMPQAVYVVNRFDAERPGTVSDYGDYSSVQNLTSETNLARVGDKTSFEVDEGIFQYQGNLANTVLPWKFSLAYELDGKKVTAEELAGASGKLAIQVVTSKNTAVDSRFYDSFMLQITFTLPGSGVFDVTASEGATIATSGQDLTVAFTVLPGHDGDFELTARVVDFSMPGAKVVALPYTSLVELPDTDSMVDDMTSLSDAVSELSSGTASLASGVDALTSGARDLSSGAAAFGEGLSRISGSSSDLVGSSAVIKDSLQAIAARLSDTDFSQLDQLEQLPDALTQMANGLDTLQANASMVQQGYVQSLSVLDDAITAIPDSSLSDPDIGSLVVLAQASANPQDAVTVNELVATYQAAQTVKGTYVSTKVAFDGASGLLSSLVADAANGGALATQAAALRSMASSLDVAVGGAQLDQIPQLADGIVQLSNTYGLFHDGLVQYASGLMALEENYCSLESGTAQLAGGASQLAGGASTLYGGMSELESATITLPETMRAQIAEMTADYNFPTFEPASFVSNKNKDMDTVQFVMSTTAIEKPEIEEVEQPEVEPSLWDRFVALFQS